MLSDVAVLDFVVSSVELLVCLSACSLDTSLIPSLIPSLTESLISCFVISNPLSLVVSVSLGLLASDLTWIGLVTVTSMGLVTSTSVGSFGSFFKCSLSLHEPNVSVSREASATGRIILLYNVFFHCLVWSGFVLFSGLLWFWFYLVSCHKHTAFFNSKIYFQKNSFKTFCLVYTFCLLKIGETGI